MIVNLDLTVAIVTSAGVTVFYTMIGQMISVAYTDVVQLIFIVFGLVSWVPDNGLVSWAPDNGLKAGHQTMDQTIDW